MKTLLQLHQQDNIAMALESLASADQASVRGRENPPITVLNDIPKMHKIALRPIAQGQAVLKYGQAIGFASRNIHAGEHVHSHNCAMGAVEKDYGFCREAKPTRFFSASEQRFFQGYIRDDGRVGTRNYIGILTTVNCSATVAQQIAKHFDVSCKESWPNVDGVVALTHTGGCGMRDGDEGYATLQRTFEGYLRHPNFGGILVLGLGCETMQVKQVLRDAGLDSSAGVKAFTIQELGGTRKTVEQGIAHINALLPVVNGYCRSEVPVSELVLAVQCGGSDAFSGITANPALGIAGDLLIRHGGTVIYSETPEIYGAEHLLTQRSQSDEVAEKLLQRIRWWEDYTQRHGFDLDNNPSPGNKQGGLTTIVEKSLGAQSKSGSTNLLDVCLYAEPPSCKGLVFMDSPGFDPVSVTGQVASGANVICFTTGRGSAFGYKPVPSIKLSSNTDVFRQMEEDIDINCGQVIDGDMTLDTMGETIFAHLIAVASGESSKSELLGYGDAEFNPWKIGAVL